MRINNTAFTLLEILLAAIIFMITVGSVFATLSAVRQPVIDKENALTAAIFGKQVLETLRNSVNAQATSNFYVACTGNCTDVSLALGAHLVPLPYTFPSGQQIIMPPTLTSANGGGSGTLNYTVSCADGTTNCAGVNPSSPDMARRVDLNISW